MSTNHVWPAAAPSDRFRAALADTIGTSVLARLVATRLVEQVTAGPADKVATIVRGIRVGGVVLCVLGGRDLGSCRCLRALAASVRDDHVDAAGDAGVRRALGDGLEPFLPAGAAALPG